MTGSFACGSALCSAPTRSVTHERRIGAGRSILTNGQTAAAIDKSYMGTWKANIAKSKYQPGPPPKESTRVHEDRGNGFVLVTTDTVNAQGQKTHGAYVYKPDGKQYPQAGLNQANVQTIALTAVDPYTVTFTTYVDGKAVSNGKRTVNKDGKTMIIETKGTNAQGQPTSTYAVWETVVSVKWWKSSARHHPA